MPVSNEARASLHHETPLQVVIDTGAVIHRALELRLLPLGMGVAQQRILAAVLRAPGRLQPTTLADLLLQETHSISGMLNRLEDQHGFITRTRDKADRRVVWIGLTPEGRSVAERSERVVLETLQELEQSLGGHGDEVASLAARVRDHAMPIAGFTQADREYAFEQAGLAKQSSDK